MEMMSVKKSLSVKRSVTLKPPGLALMFSWMDRTVMKTEAKSRYAMMIAQK